MYCSSGSLGGSQRLSKEGGTEFLVDAERLSRVEVGVEHGAGDGGEEEDQ